MSRLRMLPPLGPEDIEKFLEWRGIEEPCEACGGRGSRMYPNTATWKGGMAGQAFTSDVCDRCWGSGDRHYPWTNLRELRDKFEADVAKAALTRLAEAAGAPYKVCAKAAVELADEIERLTRGRKPRPPSFTNVCLSLAKAIRKGVDERAAQ